MKKAQMRHSSVPKRIHKAAVRASGVAQQSQRRERAAMMDVGILAMLGVLPTEDHKFLAKGRPSNVSANGKVWHHPGVIVSKKPKIKVTKDGKVIHVHRGVPLEIFQMLTNRRKRKAMKRYVW